MKQDEKLLLEYFRRIEIPYLREMVLDSAKRIAESETRRQHRSYQTHPATRHIDYP